MLVLTFFSFSLVDDTSLLVDPVHGGSKFFVITIEYAGNLHMKRWIDLINFFFQILRPPV